MKKYYFVLADDNGSELSGYANTLVGVRYIFKKVTNASVCEIYRKCGIIYEAAPFITYLK